MLFATQEHTLWNILAGNLVLEVDRLPGTTNGVIWLTFGSSASLEWPLATGYSILHSPESIRCLIPSHSLTLFTSLPRMLRYRRRAHNYYCHCWQYTIKSVSAYSTKLFTMILKPAKSLKQGHQQSTKHRCSPNVKFAMSVFRDKIFLPRLSRRFPDIWPIPSISQHRLLNPLNFKVSRFFRQVVSYRADSRSLSSRRAVQMWTCLSRASILLLPRVDDIELYKMSAASTPAAQKISRRQERRLELSVGHWPPTKTDCMGDVYTKVVGQSRAT